MEPVYSIDETVTPLAIQKSMSTSYFNHYKEIIKLRNSNRALALGDLELYEGELPGPVMAFFRKHTDQEVVVFHNLSDQSIEMIAPEEAVSLLYSYGNAKWEGGKVILPGYASLLLSVSGSKFAS